MRLHYHEFIQTQYLEFLRGVYAEGVLPELRKRFWACVLRPFPCVSTRLASGVRQTPFAAVASSWKTVRGMPCGDCAQGHGKRTNSFRPSRQPDCLVLPCLPAFVFPTNHLSSESVRICSRNVSSFADTFIGPPLPAGSDEGVRVLRCSVRACANEDAPVFGAASGALARTRSLGAIVDGKAGVDLRAHASL